MKRNAKTAGKFVVLGDSDSISAETVRIENRIRQRAFEISQSRGHAGREIEDWLSAESEIISVPPLELTEKDGAFVVNLALAGIGPGDIQIVATPEQLLIKGEFRHDHREDAGAIHYCEFKSATVFRAIQLPRPIDPDSLEVEFHDGMLQIRGLRRDAASQATKSAPRRSSRSGTRSKSNERPRKAS